MAEFELLLENKKIVKFEAADEDSAALRYEAIHEVKVIATRPVQHGLYVLGRGRIIG